MDEPKINVQDQMAFNAHTEAGSTTPSGFESRVLEKQATLEEDHILGETLPNAIRSKDIDAVLEAVVAYTNVSGAANGEHNRDNFKVMRAQLDYAGLLNVNHVLHMDSNRGDSVEDVKDAINDIVTAIQNDEVVDTTKIKASIGKGTGQQPHISTLDAH